MATLQECALQVPIDIRSDKDRRVLDLYDQLLTELGDTRSLNLLEVGVFKGGSLLAFAQRLPNARLLGVDISEPPEAFFLEVERLHLGDRVTFRKGSQTNAYFLGRVIQETFGGEKLDAVTEDAIHTYAGSRASFDALFVPWVRTGGFYAIEDWGTGYWPAWPDGHPDGRHGMVRLVKELIDDIALPDRTKVVEGFRALPSGGELVSPISHAVIANTVAAYFRGDGDWLPRPRKAGSIDTRVLRRQVKQAIDQVERLCRRLLD